MRYAALKEEKIRHLSFYLAMEEYLARRVLPTLGEEGNDGLFFMWQVRPSVIFGRNQVAENEVNLDYCREHGIEVFRRKSGGGCVYADEDNLMFSFVTSDENVNFTYNRFMGMLLLVLRRLGIEATGTNHNDVLIGDRKVSGTAFYHLPGASIVHATMLYDTNMDHMLNAITPSSEKLQRKGVESVRQRITLLKDYIVLSISELKDFVRQTLCQGETMLTPADVAAIEELEQEYLKEEFIHLKL